MAQFIDLADLIAAQSSEPPKSRAWAWIFIALTSLMVVVWDSGIIAHHHSFPHALALTALLIVLGEAVYVLTGFEVAFIDLRDKDPSQVSERLRPLLAEMQDRQTALYESKEWCVVGITIALVFLAEYHFNDHVSGLVSPMPKLKSSLTFLKPFESLIESLCVLVFTTIPILWLAQAPAKQIAASNSEAFLSRWGRPVWWVLQRVGRFTKRLHFSAPSELIVDFFRRGPSRNLDVSLSSHYMMSLRRFGHAYHLMEETVRIHADGTSTFTLSDWRCLLKSSSDHFEGKLKVPHGIRSFDVRILSAYQMPLPGESFKDWDAQIAALGRPGGDWKKIKPNAFEVQKKTEDNTNSWRIDFRFDPRRENKALLIQYQVRFELNAGNYEMPGSVEEDFHQRSFDWPVRQYNFTAEFDNNAQGGFANVANIVTFGGAPHDAETERSEQGLNSEEGRINLSVEFPLPGAKYRITWKAYRDVPSVESPA